MSSTWGPQPGQLGSKVGARLIEFDGRNPLLAIWRPPGTGRRVLRTMNLVRRYRGSKGVRNHRQEEPPLGNLAATCHWEESASHHMVSDDERCLSAASRKVNRSLRPFAHSKI